MKHIVLKSLGVAILTGSLQAIVTYNEDSIHITGAAMGRIAFVGAISGALTYLKRSPRDRRTSSKGVEYRKDVFTDFYKRRKDPLE
jgi:hypothetical protein